MDGHCNEPSGTESFCERLSVGLPELFYKEVVGAVSCPPSLCVGFSLSPAKTALGARIFSFGRWEICGQETLAGGFDV